MKTENINEIFPKGNPASPDLFTGNVFVQPLVSTDESEGLYTVGQVTFTPGARTNWHTHPIGQTLLITEGKGWYQERGKTARALQKGDICVIPKDVEHWHGATNENTFIHLAITNMAGTNGVTWMNPVNNEEYNEVNQ